MKIIKLPVAVLLRLFGQQFPTAMTQTTELPALVIDDFATMTRVMKVLLQRVGFNDVDVCQDGETALRMLKERKYGLVICDLEMEPVSGVEFVRRARADSSGQSCVLLLITASRESASKARAAGVHRLANDIILKPFTSEDLKAKLLEITERSANKKAAGN